MLSHSFLADDNNVIDPELLLSYFNENCGSGLFLSDSEVTTQLKEKLAKCIIYPDKDKETERKNKASIQLAILLLDEWLSLRSDSNRKGNVILFIDNLSSIIQKETLLHLYQDGDYSFLYLNSEQFDLYWNIFSNMDEFKHYLPNESDELIYQKNRIANLQDMLRRFDEDPKLSIQKEKRAQLVCYIYHAMKPFFNLHILKKNIANLATRHEDNIPSYAYLEMDCFFSYHKSLLDKDREMLKIISPDISSEVSLNLANNNVEEIKNDIATLQFVLSFIDDYDQDLQAQLSDFLTRHIYARFLHLGYQNYSTEMLSLDFTFDDTLPCIKYLNNELLRKYQNRYGDTASIFYSKSENIADLPMMFNKNLSFRMLDENHPAKRFLYCINQTLQEIKDPNLYLVVIDMLKGLPEIKYKKQLMTNLYFLSFSHNQPRSQKSDLSYKLG